MTIKSHFVSKKIPRRKNTFWRFYHFHKCLIKISFLLLMKQSNQKNLARSKIDHEIYDIFIHFSSVCCCCLLSKYLEISRNCHKLSNWISISWMKLRPYLRVWSQFLFHSHSGVYHEVDTVDIWKTLFPHTRPTLLCAWHDIQNVDKGSYKNTQLNEILTKVLFK